jgi:glutamate synthase (NADPH/NADH)
MAGSASLYHNNTPPTDALPFVSATDAAHASNGFDAVKRDPESWSGALPANQGLYLNENEKDACGVGFVCHIKGQPSHKIVSDARNLLCAMTHRGATGADSRDGDGAGVMTAIPHEFFKREAEREIGCTLPEAGEYGVGNVFFKANDPVQLQSYQSVFAKIANDLGLRVLGWREVPKDGTILGPAASSKEPAIYQPLVVLRAHYGDGNISQGGSFDVKHFERQLYVLRKYATHRMFVIFCSYLLYVLRSTHVLDFFEYKVRSQKAFTSVHYRPRISYIRDSFPLPKYTITITISAMFCIAPILHWFIHVSRPTLSQAGIELNL